MGTFWKDFRFAARMLWKNRGVTAVAVVALALGVGANTAVFSVVNAVLLKPLPYKDPGRLVRLASDSERIPQMSVSYPDFLDWRAQSTVFERMAAMQPASYNLSGAGEAERLQGRNVSPEFFSVLGVEPALGRTFSEEENAPNRGRVAVISHGLWQRRFGGARDILGRVLTLNGEPYTVVGVTPPNFIYGVPTDVFVPIGSVVDEFMMMRGNHPGIYVLARMKPGVTPEGALQEMKTIAARLEAQYPASNAGNTVALQPLNEFFVSGVRPSLLVLLAAVGLVLLIACANIANLLLARAASRGREIAIRTALGASRLRVMRQLLTESVLLALVGGGVGLLLALWSVDILRGMASGNLPATAVISLDANVLLFTLGVSLLTGLVFGLAPALQASRTDLNTSLKEGGRSQTGGAARQRVRSALVVAEVALSMLLLVGAGLLLKSFINLREAPLGFEPRGLLTMQVSRTIGKGETPARAVAYFDDLNARVAALPGVKAVTYAAGMPQLGAPETTTLVEGRPAPPAGKEPQTVLFVTSPGYLDAMGIRLIRGRFFNERDTLMSQRVAVVDEAFAQKLFPGEDPVGQRLQGFEAEGVPPAEIVGIVGHVNNYGLNVPEPVQPQLYYPFKQVPEKYLPEVLSSVYVAARTTGDAAALAPLVRRESQAIDPAQPLYQVNTMEEVIAQSIATQKLSTTLLGLFAAVALALAGVGIYGVMSYAVTQRRHEIGVRMALGAQPRDVLRMVVGQGMLLAAVGLAVGLAGAFALTRVMSSLLYGVSATDPFVFLSVPLALAAVALLANLVPARRAMRVDPMVALRYE
ncbi:MAG TPA: ABC transporter permease [Pyrinomonadaceae bacterium]|nr:ABC transporter permease [Pyrinomonadaceae bacterium]